MRNGQCKIRVLERRVDRSRVRHVTHARQFLSTFDDTQSEHFRPDPRGDTVHKLCQEFSLLVFWSALSLSLKIFVRNGRIQLLRRQLPNGIIELAAPLEFIVNNSSLHIWSRYFYDLSGRKSGHRRPERKNEPSEPADLTGGCSGGKFVVYRTGTA
jgi:hypothetical protein